VNRIEIESKLNEGRNEVLARFSQLTDEQLHRPLTQSGHDPSNHWTALDHFSHLALVERNFQVMIRRHLAGDSDPVGLLSTEDGAPRSREEITRFVHAMTEQYQQEHRDDSFSRAVAISAAARGETLVLLAELSDAQLGETLAGAPWADGTLGGVLGANADHARTHWHWVTNAGLLSAESESAD